VPEVVAVTAVVDFSWYEFFWNSLNVEGDTNAISESQTPVVASCVMDWKGVSSEQKFISPKMKWRNSGYESQREI